MINEWITNSSGKLLLFVILVAFVGGGYVGKTYFGPPKAVCPQPAITTESKSTEHTSLNKVVKTVKEIKQKDGTVIKTTTVEKDSSKVFKKDDERTIITPNKQVLTKYSLGLKYLPSITDKPSMKDVEIEGGARLGESPFWLKGGYDVKHNQLSIGIDYTW